MRFGSKIEEFFLLQKFTARRNVLRLRVYIPRNKARSSGVQLSLLHATSDNRVGPLGCFSAVMATCVAVDDEAEYGKWPPMVQGVKVASSRLHGFSKSVTFGRQMFDDVFPPVDRTDASKGVFGLRIERPKVGLDLVGAKFFEKFGQLVRRTGVLLDEEGIKGALHQTIYSFVDARDVAHL